MLNNNRNFCILHCYFLCLAHKYICLNLCCFPVCSMLEVRPVRCSLSVCTCHHACPSYKSITKVIILIKIAKHFPNYFYPRAKIIGLPVRINRNFDGTIISCCVALCLPLPTDENKMAIVFLNPLFFVHLYISSTGNTFSLFCRCIISYFYCKFAFRIAITGLHTCCRSLAHV